MIINIKNKKDLITLDLRVKQIRYLRDIEKQGEILFMDLSRDDVEGYEYLFNEDKNIFLETLQEDILSNTGIKINVKDLEVLNDNK